jgi:hypothetical protein
MIVSTRIARPNNIPESSDRIDFTRITQPNGNETFGQNSGNSFGPHSGSDIIFGPNSGNESGKKFG